MSNKIDRFQGDYYFLSNFFTAPVTYDGFTYGNNEAAFQAQKCASREERQKFTEMNPSEAKKCGRSVTLRRDWEQIKVKVMHELVQAKFEQNPLLAERLLDTGDVYLEEGNTWGDRIWGTVDGKGANQLGRILMTVREYIREREKEPDREI